MKKFFGGHKISYTIVRDFVNNETFKVREIFIRKHAEIGYDVEFDWGEIKLEIN